MVDNQEQVSITLNVFNYPPGFKEMKKNGMGPGKDMWLATYKKTKRVVSYVYKF